MEVSEPYQKFDAIPTDVTVLVECSDSENEQAVKAITSSCDNLYTLPAAA